MESTVYSNNNACELANARSYSYMHKHGLVHIVLQILGESFLLYENKILRQVGERQIDGAPRANLFTWIIRRPYKEC